MGQWGKLTYGVASYPSSGEEPGYEASNCRCSLHYRLPVAFAVSNYHTFPQTTVSLIRMKLVVKDSLYPEEVGHWMLRIKS